MYQTGDTIRLKATFKTFDGDLSDLYDRPTLTIYNSDEDVIEVISGDLMTNPSTGVYYYDYTLPSTAGKYIYEFSGINETTNVLRRGNIQVGFL